MRGDVNNTGGFNKREEELYALSLLTGSFPVFPELSADAGLPALREALTADSPSLLINGAARYFAALTESGCADNPAAYFWSRFFLTGGVVQRAAAEGRLNKLPSAVLSAAENELKIAERLSGIAAEELYSYYEKRAGVPLPDGVKPLLPVWTAAGNGVKNKPPRFTLQNLEKEITANGFGIFRNHTACRYAGGVLEPAAGGGARLNGLKDYEREKAALVTNTLDFLKGAPAQNVLLYGDRGTGKSSSVQALAAEYGDRGLRLAELPAAEAGSLPALLKLLDCPVFKYIIFIDDLSFNEGGGSFSALKAALEGSLQKPENALIYATTNRRHIIRETFEGRGGEVHAADAREESLSLSDRFGLVITYMAPDKKEFLSILTAILKDRNLTFDPNVLSLTAERFALKKGGRTPRFAKQLADIIEAAVLRGVKVEDCLE